MWGCCSYAALVFTAVSQGFLNWDCQESLPALQTCQVIVPSAELSSELDKLDKQVLLLVNKQSGVQRLGLPLC